MTNLTNLTHRIYENALNTFAFNENLTAEKAVEKEISAVRAAQEKGTLIEYTNGSMDWKIENQAWYTDAEYQIVKETVIEKIAG